MGNEKVGNFEGALAIKLVDVWIFGSVLLSCLIENWLLGNLQEMERLER